MPLRTRVYTNVHSKREKDINVEVEIAKKIKELEKQCFKVYRHDSIKIVDDIRDDRWYIYFDIVYDPPSVAKASPEGCPK